MTEQKQGPMSLREIAWTRRLANLCDVFGGMREQVQAMDARIAEYDDVGAVRSRSCFA